MLVVACGSGGPKELTDANGRSVPRDVARIRRGDAHCDWKSVTIVRIGQRQYIADPKKKIMPGQYVGDYAANVPVPADAIDTGYRSGKTRVFLAKDQSVAYLLRGDTAQRLPAVVPGFGCD